MPCRLHCSPLPTLCPRCAAHFSLAAQGEADKVRTVKGAEGSAESKYLQASVGAHACGRAPVLKAVCRMCGLPRLLPLRSTDPAPLALLVLPHGFTPRLCEAAFPSFVQGQGLARFLIAISAGVRESLKVLVTGRCVSASARFRLMLCGTLAGRAG